MSVLRFWLLAVLSCLLSITYCRSSSSSSSSTFFEASVRSLDQYGNAVQLQHAQAAADQQGRLIIAICRANHVWVISPQPRLLLHRQHHHLLVNDPSMFLLSQLHRDASLAMTCSGVQADAQWLLRKLQQHAKNVWERCNAVQPDNIVATAHVVARLVRLFWDYDTTQLWQPATLPNTPNDVWSRPMGIRTLLVTAHPTPRIVVVEPSGSIHRDDSAVVVCIGKHSLAVQTVLEEKLHDTATTTAISDGELEELLLSVVASHVGDCDQLCIETLDAHGTIERRRVSRNGNELPQ